MRVSSVVVVLLVGTIGIQSASIAKDKRSHHHVPSWLDHCWDENFLLKDPFCDMLTDMTTTSTMAPTTTARTCSYEVHNDSDITVTDVQTGDSANGVHVKSPYNYCLNFCKISTIHNGHECWAFTYNDDDGCFLYYSTGLIRVTHSALLGTAENNTALFLKRCSDDPFTAAPTKQTTLGVSTTQAPPTEVTTQAPVDTDTPTTTPQPTAAPVPVTSTVVASTNQPPVIDQSTAMPTTARPAAATSASRPDQSTIVSPDQTSGFPPT